MIIKSNSVDFSEVPRTKHIKKRLIKSRVLTKLMFSLSTSGNDFKNLPFSEKHMDFIKTLTSTQLSEFSCILISDFSVNIAIDYNQEFTEFSVGSELGELIAKYYINEWILTCANDYRILYDEYSRGLPSDVLKKLVQATPVELKQYACELSNSGLIICEYDHEAFERTTLKAKHLFRQDLLIIKAVSSGASLPQIKTFFSNHRLCDSRQFAVIKKIHSYKSPGESIAEDIQRSIVSEYQRIELPFINGNATKEQFLSTLYNLHSSFLERFDVSFSDSWNAIQHATRQKSKQLGVINETH